MRGQTLPPRTVSSYVNQTPTGYVVKLYVKRDDGQEVGTRPHPTVTEALREAEQLAKDLGYTLV